MQRFALNSSRWANGKVADLRGAETRMKTAVQVLGKALVNRGAHFPFSLARVSRKGPGAIRVAVVPAQDPKDGTARHTGENTGARGQMTQIDELQTRLSRALDRIGQRLEAHTAGPDGAELEALTARLTEAETALAEAETRAAAAAEATETERAAAIEAARLELAEEHASALATLRGEAAAEQELAVSQALEKAAEERDAVIAAVRAEAEAAVAAAGAGDGPAEAAADDGADRGEIEAELTALREALEDEKVANAQLEERMRHLKARLAEAEAGAGGAGEAGGVPAEMIEGLDAEVQRLRAANAALSESNAALRAANAQGVGDASLINEAMQVELDGLRAARAVDAAETEALIATLTPLLDAAGPDGQEANS